MSQLFKQTALKQTHKTALQIQRNKKTLKWSWLEFYNDSIKFAKSMHSLGIQNRKSVNIMGFNSPEWMIACMGGIAYDSAVTGVYITNQADAVLYQAEHSECELAVVDSIENLKKFEVNQHKLPNLKAIVVYNLDQLPDNMKDSRYFVWNDFLNIGKSVPDAVIDQKMMSQKPGKACCLIYTSGTTGNPKGVMLSHDNVVWTSKALVDGAKVSIEPDDRIVSYLPLSHIAGFVFDVMFLLHSGCECYFAKPDAL